MTNVLKLNHVDGCLHHVSVIDRPLNRGSAGVSVKVESGPDTGTPDMVSTTKTAPVWSPHNPLNTAPTPTLPLSSRLST